VSTAEADQNAAPHVAVRAVLRVAQLEGRLEVRHEAGYVSAQTAQKVGKVQTVAAAKDLYLSQFPRGSVRASQLHQALSDALRAPDVLDLLPSLVQDEQLHPWVEFQARESSLFLSVPFVLDQPASDLVLEKLSNDEDLHPVPHREIFQQHQSNVPGY